MTDITLHQSSTPVQIDQGKILQALNLNPNDANTQALLLVCQRYELDPLLKHMILIKGNPYVTRDGYLAIAHRSGQFDGMEVLETGQDATHWTAKVAVYRKDMSRPITYAGRYPFNGDNKKYGPEMAIKVAEVAALRRAFNVTGIGAAEESWDAEIIEVVPNADQADIDELKALISALADDEKATLKDAWIEAQIPPIDRLPADRVEEVRNLIGSQQSADSAQPTVAAASGSQPATDVRGQIAEGSEQEEGSVPPAPPLSVKQPGGPKITPGTRAHLFGLIPKHLKAKDDRLAYVAGFLGLDELDSFNSLTENQARAVIDTIEGGPVPEGFMDEEAS